MGKTIKRPSENDQNGRSYLFKKIARSAAIWTTVASVAILSALVGFDLLDDALALTRHDETPRSITVSELSGLPEELHKEGFIKHPWLFSLYISIKGKDMERQTAVLSKDMDYRALLGAFTDAPVVRTVRISFPRTSTVTDIIDIFLSNGIGSREGFISAINSYPFEFDFINEIPNDSRRLYRLEGYLYPDTYDFYTGRSESYYINKMLERFDAVMTELTPLCRQAGMSMDEALTVASMIECSAGFSSAYERMSSVINNRLDARISLDIPASSVYGISAKSGLYKGEAHEELISCDTPYNTFINKGLPPSAICNPTREALLCAIYPEESPYMYFFTRSNGTVLFAETVTEHRQNIASQ